jgi:RND family efflux transporter MFP subunit
MDSSRELAIGRSAELRFGAVEHFPQAGFRLVLALLLLLSLLLFVGCNKSGSSGGSGAAKYHCPMHPTYTSDRPADCPICNMKLVPIKQDGAKPTGSADKKPTRGQDGEYACPDHPDFIFDKPGECGICDKRLVRANSEGEPAEPEAAPGRTMVAISPAKQQLIGLRTAAVEKRELIRTVRGTAVVEHDETRYARVAPRFNGWVRKLHINYTGQHVEKGAPLFTVYSPDLLATENEYLLAWKQVAALQLDAPTLLRDSTKALLDSARRRLLLWEVGEEEIRALEQRGTPSDEVAFRAPVSGHVLAKNAVEGKAFMMGETLYEIADLDRVWLRASVLDQDLPLLQLGQTATIAFPYLGKSVESKITFFYPHIDAPSRRAQVRFDLDNPGHALRPDHWANVEIKVLLGDKLVIPASAVIDTGDRLVAFVPREDDHMEPRVLKIGVRTDDWWEVLSGVKEGEKVVTRALFLVDSESQLKAAISGMSGGSEH